MKICGIGLPRSAIPHKKELRRFLLAVQVAGGGGGGRKQKS